jgi:DNA polymerase-3 subunit beta
MKLTFKAAQLAAAVTWTARYAKPGHQVPILSGLLFQPLEPINCDDSDADACGWTVTGYDYDHCATAALEPSVFDGEPERFVLHGRWLASLVAKLRGEVTLDIDNGVATITSGRGRWTMPCMAAGAYPDLPSDPPSIGAVQAATMRSALANVGYATHKDDGILPELTMACVTSTADHLQVAVTDRHRISRVFLPWRDKPDYRFLIDPDMFGATLPDSGVEAALLLDPDNGMTGVACGDRVLVSRGINDAKFPPVASFFERPVNALVTANRSALLDALEQATLTAEAKTLVLFEFDADSRSLTLEAHDKVLSSAGSVEIDAHVTVTGWSALSLRYIRDAVKAVATGYVTLGFEVTDGSPKPMHITSSDDDTATEWVPDTTHQQVIMSLKYDR